MTVPIINLAQWYASPAGQHLRQWEQARCDQAVGDCFGYHALQIGSEHLPLLRNSRIQQRWVAGIDLPPALAQRPAQPPHLVLEPMALPFAQASLDLVLLPHTLEASADPHATLREVARVLVPEGRLLVIGFNPNSLWGMQQGSRALAQRMGSSTPPFIPDVDDLIGYRRLRDWLRLLGFEVNGGRFGCYRPGLHSPKWFEHLDWLERAGDRWWPFWGGVYFLQAIKRVKAPRLLQPRWKLAKQARSAVPAVQRGHTDTASDAGS